MRAVLFVLLADHVAGHGHITLPASTRHGGSVKTGNACVHYSCAWFSNIVAIPSTPTLPNAFRTLQLNVTTLPQDVYATSPWRAPGKAPVLGSGCGVGGGNQMPMLNGGECSWVSARNALKVSMGSSSLRWVLLKSGHAVGRLKLLGPSPRTMAVATPTGSAQLIPWTLSTRPASRATNLISRGTVRKFSLEMGREFLSHVKLPERVRTLQDPSGPGIRSPVATCAMRTRRAAQRSLPWVVDAAPARPRPNATQLMRLRQPRANGHRMEGNAKCRPMRALAPQPQRRARRREPGVNGSQVAQTTATAARIARSLLRRRGTSRSTAELIAMAA